MGVAVVVTSTCTVRFVTGFPSNCNNNIYETETPSLMGFPVSGFNELRLRGYRPQSRLSSTAAAAVAVRRQIIIIIIASASSAEAERHRSNHLYYHCYLLVNST